MRILQINAVYGIGSTGFYTRKMHEMLLSGGEESYVICRRMSPKYKNAENVISIGNNICVKLNALYSRISGMQAHAVFFTTGKIIKRIKEISPDIIQLGNIHDNFINIKMLLEYIAESGISLVVTLHDCWFFTGKCMYYSDAACSGWMNGCSSCPKLRNDIPSFLFDKTKKMLYEKKNLFDKIKKLAVVGVSERITADAAKSIVFNGRKCVCIRNAIDESVFFSENSSEQSREKIVFGASSKWSSFKGIDDFIFLSKYLKDNYNGDVKIVLAGDIGALSRKKRILISECGIETVGEKNAYEMAELYRKADVFVSASRSESFGCSIAEAVMCGVPVVSYDGYAEYELAGRAGCGECVPVGNREKLAEAVCKILYQGKECYSNVLAESAKQYSLSEYYADYIKLFYEII